MCDELEQDVWEWNDTAEITVRDFAALEARFAKLNKRADKLGVPHITVEILEEFARPVVDEHGNPDIMGRTIPCYKIKTVGEYPHYADWTFLATIESHEGGNIIRAIPDANEDELKALRSIKQNHCDHCNKSRNRVDTFIVRNDKTGELKQIGRNCIKDFLGGKDPKAIMHWFIWRNETFSFVEEAEEKNRSARIEPEADTIVVLACAAAAIRNYGYKKASEEYMGSTTDIVRTVLFSMRPLDKRDGRCEWFDKIVPTTEDKAEAEAILAWFKSLDEETRTSNTFMHNLNVLLGGKYTKHRDVGFVTAVFPTHKRMTTEKVERPQRSNVALGNIGDKLELKVKVLRENLVSGAFGRVQIVAMEDEAGNDLVWFNNGKIVLGLGDEAVIRGTVKKHDVFNGRNQTHLTRVKKVA